MPIYLYRTILEDGTEGDVFEWEHPMNETKSHHPDNELPIKRVYVAPNLATRYTPGNTKKTLSNENIADKGFTKYERDKVSGQYHKVVGDGPSTIKKPSP